MLIRAGGGTFNKLSIPRDSYAEIPGHPPTKINAAFSYGGAALQIKTVEKFLGIQIDHVAIVDFTGFEKLIDAVGGVEVNVPHKLCADIAGGAGGGQGGVTLRLRKGANTLNGEQALAYSRIREPSECPGPARAPSASATATSTARGPSRQLSTGSRTASPSRSPPLQLHPGPVHRLGCAESLRLRHGLLHDAAADPRRRHRRQRPRRRPLRRRPLDGCEPDGPGGSSRRAPTRPGASAVNRLLNG